MVDAKLQTELLECLNRLSPQRQSQVLTFAKQLSNGLPPGTPAHELLQFAGSLSDEDAAIMLQAVEECRQVDSSRW